MEEGEQELQEQRHPVAAGGGGSKKKKKKSKKGGGIGKCGAGDSGVKGELISSAGGRGLAPLPRMKGGIKGGNTAGGGLSPMGATSSGGGDQEDIDRIVRELNLATVRGISRYRECPTLRGKVTGGLVLPWLWEDSSSQ